jgi:hypothetical protein
MSVYLGIAQLTNGQLVMLHWYTPLKLFRDVDYDDTLFRTANTAARWLTRHEIIGIVWRP